MRPLRRRSRMLPLCSNPIKGLGGYGRTPLKLATRESFTSLFPLLRFALFGMILAPSARQTKGLEARTKKKGRPLSVFKVLLM